MAAAVPITAAPITAAMALIVPAVFIELDVTPAVPDLAGTGFV